MTIELLSIIESFAELFSQPSYLNSFEEYIDFIDVEIPVQEYFLSSLMLIRHSFIVFSLNWDAIAFPLSIDLHWQLILSPNIRSPNYQSLLEVMCTSTPVTVLPADNIPILILPQTVNVVSPLYKLVFTLWGQGGNLSFMYYNGQFMNEQLEIIKYIDMSTVNGLMGFTGKVLYLENQNWLPLTNDNDLSIPIQFRTGNPLRQALVQYKVISTITDNYNSLGDSSFDIHDPNED